MMAHPEFEKLELSADLRRIALDAFRIYTKVYEHFKDSSKAAQWMITSNPNLGECPPMSLITSGRGHKVEQFIDAAIEENKPG